MEDGRERDRLLGRIRRGRSRGRFDDCIRNMRYHEHLLLVPIHILVPSSNRRWGKKSIALPPLPLHSPSALLHPARPRGTDRECRETLDSLIRPQQIPTQPDTIRIVEMAHFWVVDFGETGG